MPPQPEGGGESPIRVYHSWERRGRRATDERWKKIFSRPSCGPPHKPKKSAQKQPFSCKSVKVGLGGGGRAVWFAHHRMGGFPTGCDRSHRGGEGHQFACTIAGKEGGEGRQMKDGRRFFAAVAWSTPQAQKKCPTATFFVYFR